MTSFIAACGSGRSTSFIPAVPAAWSVATIAFIVRLPVSSSRPSTPTCCHVWLQGTAALGLGFGDRLGGFRGRSGSFKEIVLQTEKPGELERKRGAKLFPGVR